MPGMKKNNIFIIITKLHYSKIYLQFLASTVLKNTFSLMKKSEKKHIQNIIFKVLFFFNF